MYCKGRFEAGMRDGMMIISFVDSLVREVNAKVGVGWKESGWGEVRAKVVIFADDSVDGWFGR